MKKLLQIGLITLFGIQFFQPDRNETLESLPTDLMNYAQPSEEVQLILKKACYDCHSNNTTYPLYSYIQPVGWWINHHIQEGKEHLNFSEFGSYPPKKVVHKLEEIVESQETHWMPMDSYTWIHAEARLTEKERTALVAWAQSSIDSLKSVH